jgi:DNA-binding GntR family transcriptional regulator
MKEQSEPGLTSKGWIYREIRRSIIMGRCNPGERLDLEELSTSFGTSITPVRDALQMLSQEGLVTIKPRSGYFVVYITLTCSSSARSSKWPPSSGLRLGLRKINSRN